MPSWKLEVLLLSELNFAKKWKKQNKTKLLEKQKNHISTLLVDDTSRKQDSQRTTETGIFHA